ncbi:MAG TPA: DMT family transporter [Anaerolineae bacterium]|nr:DMT family transporter [Anaerolineae bacterium]
MSGELLAILSALLWAMSSVLLTIGARRLHVLPLNLVRCVVSTAFFWLLLPFYGGLAAVAAIPPSAWLWLAASVLALLIIGDTLYFRSMDLAGVSWAMPASNIHPLWVVLLAGFFLDEPIGWPLIAGALLVIGGVVLLGRTQGGAEAGRPPDPAGRRRGLILALTVSAVWALGQVALKVGAGEIHSVVINSIRQPLGMAGLLALNVARGHWSDLRQLDGRSWVVILLASLVGTGVGTLLWVTALQTAGAARTSVITSAAPLLAIPFSMLWLAERPSRWTVAGTLLTAAGVALVV